MCELCFAYCSVFLFGEVDAAATVRRHCYHRPESAGCKYPCLSHRQKIVRSLPPVVGEPSTSCVNDQHPMHLANGVVALLVLSLLSLLFS